MNKATQKAASNQRETCVVCGMEESMEFMTRTEKGYYCLFCFSDSQEELEWNENDGWAMDEELGIG